MRKAVKIMRSNNGLAMVLADSLHAVTSQCEFHTKQYVVKTIYEP